MSRVEPTVFVIDDDEAVRTVIGQLVETVGLRAETFSHAGEFLDSFDPARPGCLVLDVRMPGMSGLTLQSKLRKEHIPIPVVFMSGHGDVPMAVEAMRGGAVDFIEKPFRNQLMLDRINEAFARDARAREQRNAQDAVKSRLGLLTPREREVLNCVRAGKHNKAIATELGLSQKTVEAHRANIMKKVKVGSVVELVAMICTAEAIQ